ncbi:Uncharacterised protein [Mycobacteroides abscessus subsp. abscessus]|nr:Uncharacterised protein [Mycobacteroides abscessus subsp. abscessus]
MGLLRGLQLTVGGHGVLDSADFFAPTAIQVLCRADNLGVGASLLIPGLG